MDRRRIGSLHVSVVGVGCNNFGRRVDEAGTRAVVHAALDEGIDFFDTADAYGDTLSEQYLGRALGARRKDVVIATKFGMALDARRRGASPAYVHRAVEDSLRRLGTDYIDLYQLHVPDPSVRLPETLDALDALVRAGKVREIGCSNFTPDLLDSAAESVRPGHARFASVQNEYSLLHRAPEGGMLDACERLDVAFLPYFPLASGLLTGKYRRGEPAPEGTRFEDRTLDDARMAQVEKLAELARAHGGTLLQLALSWLLGRPRVASVVAGARSPAQVRGNVEAARWTVPQPLIDALG